MKHRLSALLLSSGVLLSTFSAQAAVQSPGYEGYLEGSNLIAFKNSVPIDDRAAVAHAKSLHYHAEWTVPSIPSDTYHSNPNLLLDFWIGLTTDPVGDHLGYLLQPVIRYDAVRHGWFMQSWAVPDDWTKQIVGAEIPVQPGDQIVGDIILTNGEWTVIGNAYNASHTLIGTSRIEHLVTGSPKWMTIVFEAHRLIDCDGLLPVDSSGITFSNIQFDYDTKKAGVTYSFLPFFDAEGIKAHNPTLNYCRYDFLPKTANSVVFHANTIP